MKLRAIFWIALIVLLGGCTGPSLEGRPFFTGAPPVVTDQATLYFYRNNATMYGSVAPTITINGKPTAFLVAGGYFSVVLPAGHYKIESTSPPILSTMKNTAFEIDLQKGMAYFISHEVGESPFADGRTLGAVEDARFSGEEFFFRYAHVPAGQATEAMKWCRLIPLGVN